MAENRLSANLFVRFWHPEKWITFGLLLILLASSVAGLSLVLMGPDWASLWQSLLFGLLLGWILALFRQSALKAIFIVVIVGFLYVLLFPGGLIVRVIAILSELLHWLFDAIWIHGNEPVDSNRSLRVIQELFISAGIILERVQTWITDLAVGHSAFDPIAANLFWNVLLWIISAWTGWVIEARRNVLLAVIPGVMLSLGTLAYGRRMSSFLYLMVGAILLLLAITAQDRRRQHWNETHVAYPMEKGRQIFNVAILATIILVFFSYLLPSLSIQQIRDWISELRKPAKNQTSHLAESLGILPGGTPASDAFRAARDPGLPLDHLIGSGPELSGNVVMTIRVNDLSTISQGGQPLPLYWRGFTYDIYTGHGWSSSATEQNSYEANEPLLAEFGPGHILIEQEVRPVEDLKGTIYYVGEPTAINIQAEAAWRSNGDLFGVQAEKSVPYTALSLVPIDDAGVLQIAGQRYPEWVRERFLTLPAEVPDRVKALAIQLTISKSTPYDRALAIENYLRTFPYTLDVSRPPGNRDVVDYFLFDLQKGYCDYYATSMVVLARAAGIPARLVIGYAPGTYNINSKRFIVTEADAHSWVEIYFPNIGWVPFEPTASYPSLERTKPVAIPEEPPIPNLPHTASSRFVSWTSLWLIWPIGLIVAGIAGYAAIVVDDLRLRRLSMHMAAIGIYQRIRRYAKFLSVPWTSSDTPYEFSVSFRNSLKDFIKRGIDESLIQHTIVNAQGIIDDVIHISYGLSSPKDMDILYHWRRLRWQIYQLWFLKTWHSIAIYFKAEWNGRIGSNDTGRDRQK